MRRSLSTSLLFALFTLFGDLSAATKGRIDKTCRTDDSAKPLPKVTAEQRYNRGVASFKKKDWSEAAKQFSIVAEEYPDFILSNDCHYHTGVAYYQMEEYDLANTYFDNYLKIKSDPKFFQEVISYKFSIAEKFRGGAKRRPFGQKVLPKLLSANEQALELYDEVIAALPSHDLATQSLFYKGCLLWKMGDFRGAIDSYQLLIRRFAKHELAPQAYLNITKVYLDQSKHEFQNPDLIALAEVNVKKFEIDYPRDERVDEAYNEVRLIKEVYAKGLFETGQFYEIKGKPQAATIYYENAIRQFPDSSIAKCCKRRLQKIDPTLLAAIDERLLEKENQIEEESADPSTFNIDDFSINEL